MKSRVLLLLVCTGILMGVSAQNFSGLQNKKLTRIDDLSSLLESQIGSLFGGKINGRIDSVVVTYDAEKTMKARIWYTDYLNGYFTITAINESKQRQPQVIAAKFSQATRPSPVEITLPLQESVPKGTQLESPFLRIDVAKKENGTGNITVFALNKKWKSELDAQNVVINVTLAPVGKAANLTNEVKDHVPNKTIKFDPAVMYSPKLDRTILRSGQNSFPQYNYHLINLPDDISGTWMNTDPNTNGITKLIVTNNNTIQGFGKCSPTDCDWGKTSLVSTGANNYRAVFSWSFKTTTLTINYNGSQLNVTSVDKYTSGGSTRTSSYSFKKNINMVAASQRLYTLKQVSVMNPNTTGQPETNTIPKGPDKNFQFSIIDEIFVEADLRRPQDITSINLNAFLDKNQKSGIVYILPADYHVKYEPKDPPEKGFAFDIQYGGQGGGVTVESTPDAPVRMSATLTASISTRELNFVKTILRASLPGFVNVKFLPLRENPQFNFQSTLGAQYSIPQDKISVLSFTDLSNDMKVAWNTNVDTKEFIEVALKAREGISASVILKPEDEDIVDQQIPANINLADIRTLGKVYLEPNVWRTKNWRNTTPYPLRLNYLHVLKKENTGKNPIIYSWSMNGAVVPSKAQASFNSPIVPAWLDNAEGVVMWVDYSIMDCSECDKNVLSAVTKGVSGALSQQIRFTIPPAVFDSLGASYFLVTVRSKQVDAQGMELKELPALKITKDETKTFSTGPLFSRDGNVDYEYKITAATTDGDFYPANDWIRSTEKENLLGKTKLKEIFRGIIPGIN